MYFLHIKIKGKESNISGNKQNTNLKAPGDFSNEKNKKILKTWKEINWINPLMLKKLNASQFVKISIRKVSFRKCLNSKILISKKVSFRKITKFYILILIIFIKYFRQEKKFPKDLWFPNYFQTVSNGFQTDSKKIKILIKNGLQMVYNL